MSLIKETCKMKTTLNKIKEYSPCQEGWEKLLKSLDKTQSDDEALTFLHILDSNGLRDCIWAMRSAPEYSREWRLFAVWCARQVEHLLTDERSINAINVAEKFANNEASQEELDTAWATSIYAAWTNASDTDLATASYTASYAASNTVWVTASYAACAIASYASFATDLATARAAQIEYLTNLFKTNK